MPVNNIHPIMGISLEDTMRERNQKRIMRKELRKESIEESNREYENEVKNSIEEETFTKEMLHAKDLKDAINPWDNEKNYEKFIRRMTEKNLNFELVKSFGAKYLNMEEVQYLLDAYLEDIDLKDIDDVIDRIADAPEGMEMDAVNLIINQTKSIGQNYILLCYIMEKLRQRKIKSEKFLNKLKHWIERYEKQESGYLLDFFQLTNIKNGSISNKNIDNLTKLNNSTINIANTKSAISFIKDNFDNNYDNVISLYIKIRANQLKLLSSSNLNIENKAQLSNLIGIEQSLIIAKSLYENQKLWFEDIHKQNLTKENLFNKVVIDDLLNNIVELLSTHFISKMNIDKIFRSCLFDINNNSSYIKLATLFLNNINKLPQVLYSYKMDKLKIISDKIKVIINELKPADKTSIQEEHEPNFLKKSISGFKKYV